jgi:hypothetical protein
VPLGQFVAVEEYLLAGRRRTVHCGRWIGDRGIDGDPAVDGVLLALHHPAVVPPTALAGRHRQVGLLRPALDLVEDRFAEPGQRRGDRLGVPVLRLEIGDRVRVVLVGEPGVLVDHGVAVERPLGRYPLGDRSCHARKATG